ncbi:helicase-exonuclease AddAB subunit AddA [Caenibacillus caldisaponilyticus]|uniref:helicase-exonuclease AddAB subunit AddA n=1 Tax=Caenibacillus caldisaponilyticus TaxID=1674942 RepID=UPI0009884CD1|nr:helicase-exonuclease AddAB subunit AddA [Caenibacillus caldisaponilyticus]
MTERLAKPKNSQWTDDQWKAIVEDGRDMLVAAAAGSGKTAVLVERIIRKVTDPHHPVDVDRLLIVTFTNAAAAEMRARIREALERELEKDPANLRLREQITLLNKAQITTLHAFCMTVVRRYYYRLDLDPAFRVADETEAALLREEVLEALMEDYYASPEHERFYELVDRYSNDRSDAELMALIERIYDFSRSHPWPEHWLAQMEAAYQADGVASLDDLVWTSELKRAVAAECRGMLAVLDNAAQIAAQPGGPYPYLETFESDRALVNRLIAACDGPWEALYDAFSALSFTKLKTCRGDDIDEELKNRAKALREEVKKRVNQLREELFARPPQGLLEDLREVAPYVSLLARIVKDFGERYRAAKREKALVDFSDLEHDCLAILREEGSTPAEERPSSVAMQYRAQFEEILVDEYQDTNFVQEAILQLISRGDNLFMVGDVKQSIYRFRLAEPGLFQKKYKAFSSDSPERHGGLRIDLSQNFRSRPEILDGTNYVFEQIMDEEVGEIDYDERAALRFGAVGYPEAERPVEFHLLNRTAAEEPEAEIGVDEYQTAELEAHFIAGRIKALIEDGFQVHDRTTGRMRPVQYRDIVVLLRSASSWAPAMLDVFKQRGIPAYTELSTGYFEAVEVSIMMSLLRTIDNPYQDIPLAAVLRSPLVGLSGAELARIRMAERTGPYYEAVRSYIERFDDECAAKLSAFCERLEAWRNRARRGALSDLIWQIYRETGYYDYVAGLVGGEQRQANLKALYDRARQYEKTSFRGLFRFLRFIERLQDRGGDLGEARALSEQEDVVRVMTIHKSKGLEFPVVFVPGLNKKFNLQDTSGKTLLHKTLGLGTKNVDPVQRIATPTLALSAVKRKITDETLAEEMRILYVALTRAREKLILVGTVKDAENAVQKWRDAAQSSERVLPAYQRRKARSYLDWIGPALVRHPDARALHELAGEPPLNGGADRHPSKWDVRIHQAAEHVAVETAEPISVKEREERLRQWLPVEADERYEKIAAARLSWVYPHDEATRRMAKQTVTEIKRQQERFNEGYDDSLIRSFARPIADRPRFLSASDMTAAERGTVMHRMMQYLRFTDAMDLPYLQAESRRMVEEERLSKEEAEALDLEAIAGFFRSPVGRRLLSAKRVVRELSFSLALPAREVYGDWPDADENVLVQGVIDCLYEDEHGLALLDYKTDAVRGRFASMEEAEKVLLNRYRKQLELYRLAIERIWKRRVGEAGLFFFDGGYYFKLD